MTNFKVYLIVETVQFPAKTHIRNYFSVNREAANIAVESVGKKIGDSMPINCSFTLSGSFGNQKYLAITLIKPQLFIRGYQLNDKKYGLFLHQGIFRDRFHMKLCSLLDDKL